MAFNRNRVELAGNLVADPEIRHTQAGKSVVNMRLATNQKWRDKNGEIQEATEYHTLVSFLGHHEKLAGMLSKGTWLFVEGRLQTRKWTDKDGNDRWSTEVVVQDIGLGPKVDGALDGRRENNHEHPMPSGAPSSPVMDDEVPF